MSEIVGYDAWNDQITRIYVWYPSREAGQDWQNDPAIQHILGPMSRLRFTDDSECAYYLGGSPYYWHKYATGCVWVIARTQAAR